MRPERIFVAVLLVAIGFAAAGPGCDCSGGGDWEDEALDVSCDCSGLALMVYEECSGTVLVDDEPQPVDEFAAACNEALAGEGTDAAMYRCYIEAACEADTCDDAAERLRLCNL